MIDEYWSDDEFAKSVQQKGQYIANRLDAIVAKHGEENFTVKGRGMFQGINCVNGEIANRIARHAFKKGLIIETSGSNDHVIKLLCPLIISEENLSKGLDVIEESVKVICSKLDDIPEDTDYFDKVILEKAVAK